MAQEAMSRKRSPLRERLIFTADRKPSGESVISLRATQPFFGLSQTQIHELYQMLLDADTALRDLYLSSTRKVQPVPQSSPRFWERILNNIQSMLYPSQVPIRTANTIASSISSNMKNTSLPLPPSLEEEERNNVYEIATKTLHRKVRFVARGIDQEPQAILALDTPTCELTHNELIVLDLEVLDVVRTLKEQEASWFSASESFIGTYHLMSKERYDRQGPVLCGALPRLWIAPNSHVVRGWFLRPLEVELDEQQVCPACLALWKAQQTRETHDQAGNHLARKKQL